MIVLACCRVIAALGPQKVYQDGKMLILECVSKLSGGGVVIREDAYGYLSQFKDRFDCWVVVKNLGTGWTREVRLDQLPVKPALTFPSGVRGWIVDTIDIDGSGPDFSALDESPF